jgi:hypothetical protein
VRGKGARGTRRREEKEFKKQKDPQEMKDH